MKKENVDKLVELAEEMQQDMARVIKILKDSPKYDILHMFDPDDFVVGKWGDCRTLYGETSETHWGETEYYSQEIPIEFLSMSDDELKKIVENHILEKKKADEKLKQEQEEKKKKTEIDELAQLEALAQKYGVELNYKNQ